MFKYLVLALILPLEAFWYIWGFLLAWAAADSGSGKTILKKVQEELHGRNPELTELWVFVTIMNACLLAFAAVVLILMAWKKLKKTHPKVR